MDISLFGPLDIKYCDVFTLLAIWILIMFGITTVSILYLLFMIPTLKGKFVIFFVYLLQLIFTGIQYVIFGLLYNMCKNAKSKKVKK